MLNVVNIQGRLTAQPELKHTPSDKAVTDFSIAVEDSRIVNDERKTYFFHCEAWEKCAEFICKYFEKGQQIIVEGKLINNNYTDKNGVKRTDTVVLVRSTHFSGSKSNESQQKDFEANMNNDNIPPIDK